MTQHNIVGSEAFEPAPHVMIRAVRQIRRPWHPAAKLFAIAGLLGGVASAIDVVVGAPVALTLCAAGWLALWLWPTV